MKLNSRVFYLFIILMTSLFISGCSTLKEGVASSMEVPTLEKQINRVSIGMTIVRENHLMLNKMPISSDTTWPKDVRADLDKEQKNKLSKLLMHDPYYATVRHTDIVQRDIIGFDKSMQNSGDGVKFAVLLLNRKVPPLALGAAHKLNIFYGDNPDNWPKIFENENSLKNFLEFKSGTLEDIEATKGDVYENLVDALISLVPVNQQKDLELSYSELQDAYDDVANLKSEEGELKSDLESGIQDEPPSSTQVQEAHERLQVIDVELRDAELNADEKEKIYFTLLEQSIIALQSDINLDDENYVNLAKNINLVAQEVSSSSIDAYSSFGIALRKIQVNQVFANFPTELESLAKAKLFVPGKLQKKYNKRVARLVKNSVYFLPNVFMGTYYAYKQSRLAKKYIEFTDIIIDAYAVR
jgi:hypothetical protein